MTRCSFPYCNDTDAESLCFFTAIYRLPGIPYKLFEAVLLCFPFAVSSHHLFLRFLTNHRSSKQTFSELHQSPVLSLCKQERKKYKSEYFSILKTQPSLVSLVPRLSS
ncbi:uncharacterized [Tachysurus ichikawai]